MTDKASVKILVHGRVQGVGFRFFTIRQATALGLTGYVRNLPGGTTVECVAEGERGRLEQLIDQLRRGPRMARVETLETEWSEYKGEYADFEGRR